MRPKLIAIVALSAVALVGCSAGDATNEQETNAPSESPKVEAAPLVMSEEEADQPGATINPDEIVLNDEEAREAFLGMMQPSFSGWTGDLPHEEDLLSAGMSACKSLDSGVEFLEVEAIDGASDIDPESALAKNNMRIVNAARSSLCMEHLQ